MYVNARHLVYALLCAALGAAVCGCSTLDKLGWGKAEATHARGGDSASVYYTGSDDLPLYRRPGADIIKRLPKYAKLYRDDLQGGYAHVRVAPTGESGWVENARLIWRLPQETTRPQPAEPANPPAAEAVTPPAAPAESPAPAPAMPAAPSSPSVAPSIFNPY